ncbi:MAG: autotransporter outer membrane beta-barrel domain-containing protein [Pseudomonadota bacterium]|nr:autotransporter outer membrane beta-barrel domain-containing protein [Pseudomonadota bacterium]
MKKSIYAAIGLTLSASTAVAQSATYTCDDLSAPTSLYFANISMEAGDTLNFSNLEENACFFVNSGISIAAPSSCSTSSFTAPTAGEYYVSLLYQMPPGFLPPAAKANAVSSTQMVPPGTVQCTPASVSNPGLTQGKASATGAGSSTSAIEEAIDNALGGTTGGARLTRNGVFLSTQGKGSTARAWGSLHARQFSGDVDGKSLEFTLGMDTLVAPSTRVGLILSKGRSDLDVNGSSVDIDSLSFGPYVSHKLSDIYELSAFVVMSKPEYDIDGTEYDAKRLSGGIKFDADYTLGQTEVNSYASLTGFSEKHPEVTIDGTDVDGHTVSSLLGAIGTKAIFNAGKPLRPYLGVGVDMRKFDDGINDVQEFASPRVNAGFSYEGAAGTLSLDLSGGQILEDTRDASMRLSYQMDF